MKPAGWTDIFGTAPETLGALADAADGLIRELHPNATATAYPAYRSMSYGIGPKKNTEGTVYIALQKNWVNLGFYQGASLPDPKALLEGTGKALRHVKLTEWPKDPSDYAALIDAAFAERKEALQK